MAGRNWAGGDGRDAGALLYPPPAPRARDHHKENIRNMRQAANQKRQEKQEGGERRGLRVVYLEIAMAEAAAVAVSSGSGGGSRRTSGRSRACNHYVQIST